MSNNLNANEFGRLDAAIKARRLNAMETVTAQILLAVQIMVKEARVNEDWMNWDEDDIAAFAQRAANTVKM